MPKKRTVLKTQPLNVDSMVVGGDRLTRQQKRELGLLPRQVMRRMQELAELGEIDKDMSPQELAFVYAADACNSVEYGAAWTAAREGRYSADWDAILEFLTGLMELLAKFLPIFIGLL